MTHNPIRPWRNIDRRVSRQIRVGRVLVGGDAPISVQTMTNTITSDVKATLEQVQRCAVAGARPPLSSSSLAPWFPFPSANVPCPTAATQQVGPVTPRHLTSNTPSSFHFTI